MPTLNEMTYDIKNIAYGGVQSDDVKVEDRQVQYWIIGVRSLLAQQELSQRMKIDDSYIQFLTCVEMEEVDAAECCEVEAGCTVMKSKLPIPSTIRRNGRNTILSVNSIDGEYSYSETTYFRKRFNRFNKYTGKGRRWYLKDNHLYLTDAKLVERVSISAIFEDPREAAKFSTCDGDPCYTNDMNFPIPLSTAQMVTQIVLKDKLGIARNAGNDESNNQKGDEKTTQPTR